MACRLLQLWESDSPPAPLPRAQRRHQTLGPVPGPTLMEGRWV